MSAEDAERFQSSNKCWISSKLFDVEDNTVRDHDHITGKYGGSAHWSCNINLILTKTFPAIFHNLKCNNSRLVMQEIGKSEIKVSVVPNGLEKYMVFIMNKNLVFIDSMQFMHFSLYSLVKNLSDNFMYLSQLFSGKQLKVVQQKEADPYKYMESFKKNFDEN